MAGLNATIQALRRQRNPSAGKSGPTRMRALADFGKNPGALAGFVYVPPELEANAPLVVVLHGCTQTAEAYAESAGWLALADRYGFVVLAPEQSRANNANLCFNWFQPADTMRGQGEAASIAQMVRHTIATHGIEPRRVFVSGLSAGGAMSAALLCAYPDMFAAGAVIAGVPFGAAHDLPSAFAAMTHLPERSAEDWGDRIRTGATQAGSWPRVSIWHGDADATVRPAAGEALARQWTNLHDVDQLRPEITLDTQRTHSIWKSATGEVLVEYHRVHGMGHGAPVCAAGPDGCGSAAPYMLDVGISSSLESARMWGIATTQSHRADSPREATAQVQTLWARQPNARSVDIHAIINGALRSAGLMK